MSDKIAILAFEDGHLFRGISIGHEGISLGEVIFNTAMTGYQEILTDPSYAHQIVTFTCPHIGNTGINTEDMESAKVWLSGLVIRSLALQPSSYRADMSLQDFLKRERVVGIAEIDTRHITSLVRTKGALKAALIAGPQAESMSSEECITLAKDCADLNGTDLACRVTTNSTQTWLEGGWCHGADYQQPQAALQKEKPLVIAYDLGIKHNILRLLVDKGCQVQVVPAATSAEAALAMQPDGIFLSNGPGDPAPCGYVIEATQAFLEAQIPIFGICLGHQILALACGAQTTKMKYGHHGANHPVQDLSNKQVIITSQNHGFTVSPEALPDTLRITHVSLFDQTIQGIAHQTKPAFGFQGHPEASPGPHEASTIFDDFIQSMHTRRNQRS